MRRVQRPKAREGPLPDQLLSWGGQGLGPTGCPVLDAHLTCALLSPTGKMYWALFTENSRKPLQPLGRAVSRKPEIHKGPHPSKCFHSTYKQE